MGASSQNATARVDWVDGAKGLCIVMVVMMHSTLGVEDYAGRQGFMHAVVEFARPFRMPDFFMISGLFLARVIDRDWRTYLDRKVIHFAYFYALWVTIQFALKAPGMAGELGALGVAKLYLLSFIDPFGTLWFIYLLPVFFLVTRLARRVPPLLVWTAGAALEMSHLNTGWTVPDEFAARFVYFYTGYVLAQQVFAFTAAAAANRGLAALGVLAWACLNGLLVHQGWAALPGVSLLLGFAGAMAVMTTAVLMVGLPAFEPFRYCGQHSIVIYLSFFLPMGIARTVLLKTGVVTDAGVIALIVTVSGVLGALCIWWAVRHTRLSFLFERPAGLHLVPRRTYALQPAE